MSAASAGLATNAAIAKLAYRIFFILDSPPCCWLQAEERISHLLTVELLSVPRCKGVAPAQQFTKIAIYYIILGSISAVENPLTWYPSTAQSHRTTVVLCCRIRRRRP